MGVERATKLTGAEESKPKKTAKSKRAETSRERRMCERRKSQIADSLPRSKKGDASGKQAVQNKEYWFRFGMDFERGIEYFLRVGVWLRAEKKRE